MMIFQRRTLTPESAVAASFEPIENVYRPTIVFDSSTAAITIITMKIEHAEREADARDDRQVHDRLELGGVVEVDRLGARDDQREPAAMSIMPRVAMNGGMPSTDTLTPLTSPMSPPKRMVAATPAQAASPSR